MPKPNSIEIKKFWNFTQISTTVTELLIYDYIAMSRSTDWWTGEQGNEVTPTSFRSEMDAVLTPEICVRINSGGGDIFAAEAIATAISEKRAEGKKIYCKVDGFCASAAVRVAVACETVSIPQSGYIMIHDPMTMICGWFESSELDKVSNTLGVLKQGIINAYTAKTGLSETVLSKMMDAETWMDGKTAVEKGFADEIMFGEVKTETVENPGNSVKDYFINGVRMDFAAFTQPPEALKNAFANNITQKNNPKGENEMDIKTRAEMEAAYPEFVNEIVNEATETGAKTERERIQSIDGMQDKVSSEVLNKAKYETFENAEKVALEALKNGSFTNSIITGMKNETGAANGVAGFANAGVGAGDMTEAQKNAAFAKNVAEKHFGKK